MANHFRAGDKNPFLPEIFAGTFPKDLVAAVFYIYFGSMLNAVGNFKEKPNLKKPNFK